MVHTHGMDRSQLLARVLLTLSAAACQSHQGDGAEAQTTIRVDRPAEPEGNPKSGAAQLPQRAHAYVADWQPTEAGTGCTSSREVPPGFSRPPYDGCPQRLMRMSAKVYPALRTPRPPQLGLEEDLRLDQTLTARARAEGALEACCYRRDYPMVYEGRPLRWQGTVLLPELESVDCGEGIATRNAPGARIDWQASARHEHASCASFVRLGLDLLSLGAPSRLVREAQRAAREELRHAALALSLAGLSGQECALGKLPVPRELVAETQEARIARLARELLLDAALGEGMAALEAVERAKSLPGQFRAEMLALAEEETQHALFGWRVLRWLVSERPRLLPALRALLAEAAVQATADARAMIDEVMVPALASVEAGVAAQRQSVGHLSC